MSRTMRLISDGGRDSLLSPAPAPTPTSIPTPARRSYRPDPAVVSSYQHFDFPTSVHLDTTAHIGHYDNETTAKTRNSAGRTITVSFMVVDPPGISRCVVHCPDLPAANWAEPPSITGADGAFLLIRVVFPELVGRKTFTDVFVYTAGPTPSLYLLPLPYPARLLSDHVGILSSNDAPSKHCSVVVEDDLPCFHICSTETQSWSRKTAMVYDSRGYWLSQCQISKVINIGRGWLAWVDLLHGILMCCLDHKKPELRLLPMPTWSVEDKRNSMVFSNDMVGMRRIQDVIFGHDYFYFINILHPENVSMPQAFPWTATISRRGTEFSDKWEKCCTLKSADLLPAKTFSSPLFPEIWDCQENKLNTKNILYTTPILYLDNAFYMIAKMKARDPYGWAIAINTQNMTLERAMPFSSERFSLDHNYIQSDFSKYLGTCIHFGSFSSDQMKDMGEPPLLKLCREYTFDDVEKKQQK